MRPSNRSLILDAAIRVIERDGITGVTFDSVAAESGVTRGGLLYHFPSREELLQAIHEHLAEQWQADLEIHAGKISQSANTSERFAAYLHTSLRNATRAELLLMLEGAFEPQFTAPWQAVIAQWAPPAPTCNSDSEALDLFIARLAADGLWIHEALAHQPITPELRQRIIARLTEKTRPGASKKQRPARKKKRMS